MSLARLSGPSLAILALVASACSDGGGSSPPSNQHSPIETEAPEQATPRTPSGVVRFFDPGELYTAINGTSDEDIWAVGGRSAGGWALRHWNGTVWQDFHAAAAGMPLGVWARAADDAWAVGLNGTALHWQGQEWVATDTASILAPGTGEIDPNCTGDVCTRGETSLQSVFSAAPNDVWAVGYTYPTTAGPALIVHYDGATWTRFPVDAPDGLFKVWGTSANDVWAAGSSGITLHWDGLSWTPVDGGTSLYRFGMWGAAPNDVWAVGNGGSVTRFDGQLWTSVAAEGYVELKSIFGATGGNVWAVGSAMQTGENSRVVAVGRALGRFDGSSWSTCKLFGEGPLAAVWVSSGGRVWAIGAGVEEITSVPTQCDE